MSLVSAVLLASVSLATAQPARHPFGFPDWIKLTETSARAVSPDGAWILYSVSTGAEKGPGDMEWRLIHQDGTDSHKVELPDHFRPTGFTADGRMVGSLSIDGKSEIAIYPTPELKKGGTPDRTYKVPGDIGNFKLSPDGRRFGVLADPRPKDPLDGVHTVIQASQTSLYVLNVDGSGGSWWSPELHDVADFAWSPDSSAIALESSVSKIGHYSMKSWIDVATGQSTTHVTTIDNSVAGIAWAGPKELAFTSTTTSVITPDHLYIVPAIGGAPKDVTPKILATVTGVKNGPDGTLWVSVDRGLTNELDRFADGKLSLAYQWPGGYLGGPPIFSDTAPAKSDPVLVVGDPDHCPNLAVAGAGTSLKLITHDGDAVLKDVDLGSCKVVKWTSKEGIRLEGIATFPPGFKEGTRCPFVVMPHGGPEGNDLLMLFGAVKFIASLGYVVLQPQYRGSTGYGTEFLNSIYQHFGDRAYRDVDSATDFAVAQGWADPNRLAMFGWSAGGFLTSWTVTQTNRYKAAIEGAGITDWGSFMWTSDTFQFDYDARWPDRTPAAFQKFSAVMFADRVTTPLLILHGAADQRVPTYQGREYYEELLAKGKTTRMVTYPGSGHFPYLWEQQLDVYRELAAWLKKYDP